MVEIAKAVSYSSDVLIMDEPTSALTEREVEHLFRIIRDLRAQGIGIVYITHKMNELFEIADEFSVFRDGRYIGTHASTDVTRDDIIRMMVGREITQMFPKEEVPIGDVVLSVKNLSLNNVFHDVSFDVRSGEILGVAGLVGSGRSNVAETLVRRDAGDVRHDRALRQEDRHRLAHRRRSGIVWLFLTEDRKDTGCLLILSVLENMQIAVLQDKLRQGWLCAGKLDRGDLRRHGASKLRVKTPNLDERVENLSGGNQQKVLIGRWLLTKPKILILDEPTRGIDVGAKAEIHRLVTEMARNGVAVIMISSKCRKCLGMSDRIMVDARRACNRFPQSRRSNADQGYGACRAVTRAPPATEGRIS